jgi:hypothetical protein
MKRSPKKKKFANVWTHSPYVLKLITERPIRQEIDICKYDWVIVDIIDS